MPNIPSTNESSRIRTPLRTGQVNPNNQCNQRRKQKNPSTVRSTSELKKGRPRKTTPIPKKTLNSSTLPEESTEQPSDSEYLRISVAEATAVSIFSFVHSFLYFCFMYNKLGLNELCLLQDLLSHLFHWEEPFWVDWQFLFVQFD